MPASHCNRYWGLNDRLNALGYPILSPFIYPPVMMLQTIARHFSNSPDPVRKRGSALKRSAGTCFAYTLRNRRPKIIPLYFHSHDNIALQEFPSQNIKSAPIKASCSYRFCLKVNNARALAFREQWINRCPRLRGVYPGAGGPPSLP